MSQAQPAIAQRPSTWRELITPAARVRMVVVSLLLGYTYWSAIRGQLVGKWMSDGNWSHGWLIPVFSLYLVSTRQADLARMVFRPSYLGAAVLAGAIGAYFYFGWVLPIAYLRTASIIGAIFGLVLLLGGWNVARVTWFPIAYLLLAVPLPGSIYASLTLPLRVWASKAAAMIMPMFAADLHTETQGVVIDCFVGSAYKPLNVEEACSGMRLIMAFAAIGLAMAYLGRRPLWQRLVTVAAIVPIAVFCNTIRVTVTGLFVIHGLDHLATGTPHALLGIVMLVVALGLFALIGYVLSHLFVEEADEATEEGQPT